MKRSRRFRNAPLAYQPQLLAAKNNRLIFKALKAASPLPYPDLTWKIARPAQNKYGDGRTAARSREVHKTMR
jgi:hypothetical protein